jgi:hypothetical protein
VYISIAKDEGKIPISIERRLCEAKLMGRKSLNGGGMKEIVADSKLVAYCGLYCGACKSYLKEKFLHVIRMKRQHGAK